jgi:hypothetical protein
MRLKISHGSHDPRQLDLIAILVLLVLIVAACRLFGGVSNTPNTAAFIVPGQNVRW